ncbi:MAG: tryptophan 2,3-dioxygenase family protein [Phycisphaerales bacterium]
MTLTYGSYLRIPELLSLQSPRSTGPEHDETLFIIIHQVYELWFKQQLHETDHLVELFRAGEGPQAAHTLKRMLTILKTMVAQIDVLETMTPVEFLSFRNFLASASGFQSWQFRAFESAFGHKHAGALERYPAGSAERAELERRLRAPTVWDAFQELLRRHGHAVPAPDPARAVDAPPAESPALQDLLVSLYHARHADAGLCELLVDFDEGVQEWRYRHVKMVERTIGFKRGTGGSSGAEYLRSTLFRPFFPDLWAIRTRL